MPYLNLRGIVPGAAGQPTTAMSTNAEVPKLRIPSSATLEQAMAEVRKYLAARNAADSNPAPTASQTAGSVGALSSQFTAQDALIARLSEIAARLGEVEPNSKLGPPGVYLKRTIRKAIGWYSRPVYHFDRAAIEALQQIRQDMLGLQQQVAALQQEIAKEVPVALPGVQAVDERVQARSSISQQAELLGLLIELFKNLVAVQALRQALHDEDPELLRQVEGLLSKVEGESTQLKASLLKRLTLEGDS